MSHLIKASVSYDWAALNTDTKAGKASLVGNSACVLSPPDPWGEDSQKLHMPLPSADVNLCPFTINHNPEYDGISDFCEPFQKIIEAVDSLGDIPNSNIVTWVCLSFPTISCELLKGQALFTAF